MKRSIVVLSALVAVIAGIAVMKGRAGKMRRRERGYGL